MRIAHGSQNANSAGIPLAMELKENGFVGQLTKILVTAVPEELAEDAKQSLEVAWVRYKREADHYLEIVNRAETIDQLAEVSAHYADKLALMSAEQKWLSVARRRRIAAFRAEMASETSARHLDEYRATRTQRVYQVAFPDIPYPDLTLPPEVVAAIENINQRYLEADRALGRTSGRVVRRVVNAYRRRRWSRNALRTLTERFWGFAIFTLLLDQSVNAFLTGVLRSDLAARWPLSSLGRLAILVVLAFIVWETKKVWVDSRLSRLMLRLHKRHATLDCKEAAEAQTRLELVYIALNASRKHELELQKQEESSPT